MTAIINDFVAHLSAHIDVAEAEAAAEALAAIEAADEAEAAAFDAGAEIYERRIRAAVTSAVTSFESNMAARSRSDRRTWKAAKPRLIIQVNAQVRKFIAAFRARIDEQKRRHASTGDDFDQLVADLYEVT